MCVSFLSELWNQNMAPSARNMIAYLKFDDINLLQIMYLRLIISLYTLTSSCNLAEALLSREGMFDKHDKYTYASHDTYKIHRIYYIEYYYYL